MRNTFSAYRSDFHFEVFPSKVESGFRRSEGHVYDSAEATRVGSEVKNVFICLFGFDFYGLEVFVVNTRGVVQSTLRLGIEDIWI